MISAKDYYKMISIGLRRQEALDADPRTIQQINFTTNLNRTGNTRIYFILEEEKKLFWSFHKEL